MTLRWFLHAVAILLCCAPIRVYAQDEADLRALGIRNLEGQHITLYTDLPSSPEVDELPAVFDAAVPQLEKYFELPAKTLDKWKVRASVMKNADAFRRAGLFPADLPAFLHGFARKRDLWAYDQPSDYYRRHLLLHEGVHALMAEFLKGMGPPWYAEGMAELLATHRWKDGKLDLKIFPASAEEVPMWGRVKVLREAVAAKEILTLDQIFAYDNTAHRVVPPYAWSWAAATFFESHPKYAKAFAELRQKAKGDDAVFYKEFRAVLAEDMPLLAHEWQSFVSEADYGCVVDRTYVAPAAKRPVGAGGIKLDLQADRGWQSTGAQIEAGTTYAIHVTGRYVIRTAPTKWESEPQGVTVHYHRGRPLGMILGAVLDESAPPQPMSAFVTGVPLGNGLEFTAKNSGILWLRVNEPAGGLADNQGQFTVEIRTKP